MPKYSYSYLCFWQLFIWVNLLSNTTRITTYVVFISSYDGKSAISCNKGFGCYIILIVCGSINWCARSYGLKHQICFCLLSLHRYARASSLNDWMIVSINNFYSYMFINKSLLCYKSSNYNYYNYRYRTPHECS
jgi:hypothetical protein